VNEVPSSDFFGSHAPVENENDDDDDDDSGGYTALNTYETPG
jgi:hypothetical protein